MLDGVYKFSNWCVYVRKKGNFRYGDIEDVYGIM